MYMSLNKWLLFAYVYIFNIWVRSVQKSNAVLNIIDYTHNDIRENQTLKFVTLNVLTPY